MMFREMRRKKQQLPLEECLQILKEEPRGILSLMGDGGYPYGIPIDHWYNEEDGCLYFHCGQRGHKIDAIRSCGKASYCVMNQGFRREGEWALNISSVIVFGRIQMLENRSEILSMVRRLALKYYPNPQDVQTELDKGGAHVVVLRLTPEHISGKLVNES